MFETLNTSPTHLSVSVPGVSFLRCAAGKEEPGGCCLWGRTESDGHDRSDSAAAAAAAGWRIRRKGILLWCRYSAPKYTSKVPMKCQSSRHVLPGALILTVSCLVLDPLTIDLFSASMPKGFSFSGSHLPVNCALEGHTLFFKMIMKLLPSP